ncbi:hypothetical protein A2U01_0058195 [Trifolium medium]|uniref:Uncharacterized protein n=1 Tax=Trifolium medium TaxID=97028 RepID=A0A392RK46_9FABA|nr:hypothetical protein [Trifolium medium]
MEAAMSLVGFGLYNQILRLMT